MYNIFINTVYITAIVIVTLLVMTFSFSKKFNSYQYTVENINLRIEKKKFNLVSFTTGSVEQVFVKKGQNVKKGEPVVRLINSALENRIQTLENAKKDNQSAQTELTNLLVEKESLTINAPTDGTILEILEPGDGVNRLDKVGIIFSNKDTKLLGYLTNEQYVTLQSSSQNLEAYNTRLNQSYQIILDSLKEDVEKYDELNKDKIGVYFNFLYPEEGINLLNNEKLQLKFRDNKKSVTRPMDYFINLYNKLIGHEATISNS